MNGYSKTIEGANRALLEMHSVSLEDEVLLYHCNKGYMPFGEWETVCLLHNETFAPAPMDLICTLVEGKSKLK